MSYHRCRNEDYDHDRHHRRDRDRDRDRDQDQDRDHEHRKLSHFRSRSSKDCNRQTPPSYWNIRSTIPFAPSTIYGDRPTEPLDWSSQTPPSYWTSRPTIRSVHSPIYGDARTGFVRSPPIYGNAPTKPPSKPEFEFEEGSTTLGLKFAEDGIVVAVDHSWVSDGLPENVLVINSHILLAFSGGTEISRSYLLNQLRHECSLREQSKGGRLTAHELTLLLSSYLSYHPDSDKGLSLGILIAGWDSEGLTFLFKLNGKGEYSSKSVAGTGFGSAGGISLLEIRPGTYLHLSYAINMVKKALYMGVYRVPTSLEYLAIFHVGKHGVETKVINKSIAALQKEDFNGRGSSWDPPSRRYYFEAIIGKPVDDR